MRKQSLNSFRIVAGVIILIIIAGFAISVQAKDRPSIPSAPLAQQTGGSVYLPIIRLYKETSWLMAGANPERTSWVPEQVDGRLSPLWYKQFEPYIPPKVQIITAYNTLYISTSAGLYALDAETGAEKWVYATEMPLGDSPTIEDQVAYVGGLDHRLHAVSALTGQRLWVFEAGQGFTTTPVVVNDVVYIGNRDGYFYAIRASGAQAGTQLWRYKTDGPIDYGAAYKDGVIYFASNDSHAYALNAQTGRLVWKSAKLPGAGFHTWWPVVYRDWVIFAGSFGYRDIINPGINMHFTKRELWDVYPNYATDPRGTAVGPVGQAAGDWVAQTCTIDTSRPNVTQNGTTNPITEYFEVMPWRRTYFVLNRSTGQEYTTDFDQDGQPEYAPILWQGTHSGNRYPPVVGSDDVLYQTNNYMSSPYIAAGQVSGWEIGTPYISIASKDWKAVDEPLAYSAGGNRIYWNHSGDCGSASINITVPNPIFPPDLGSGPGYCSDVNPQTDREITYFSYDLENRIPGYSTRYYPNGNSWGTFDGPNGVYGPHGTQNPPIPYHNKLYMHRSNTIIAFTQTTNTPLELPMALTIDTSDPSIPVITPTQARTKLSQEIAKVLDAGHLRPGFFNSGQFTYDASFDCGYNNQYSIGDYWHNPAETLVVLLRTLPYVPAVQQSELRTYLQEEFRAYPPYQVTHIGWKDGAAREVFDLPPEVENNRSNYPPRFGDINFTGWFYNPYGFYAMGKYAEVFPADARAIFDASKHLLETPPGDSYLIANPQVHNAYIAGYMGYLGLEALAGDLESPAVRQTLNRLLNLRATNFSKAGVPINPADLQNYCRGLNLSRNFMFLVPELGLYLHDHALAKVQDAIIEYSHMAPYWFVSSFGAVFGEGATAPLYDYHALFQAKAMILNEPDEELAKYLDIPGVAIGDLFYIHNLVALIEAE